MPGGATRMWSRRQHRRGPVHPLNVAFSDERDALHGVPRSEQALECTQGGVSGVWKSPHESRCAQGLRFRGAQQQYVRNYEPFQVPGRRQTRYDRNANRVALLLSADVAIISDLGNTMMINNERWGGRVMTSNCPSSRNYGATRCFWYFSLFSP